MYFYILKSRNTFWNITNDKSYIAKNKEKIDFYTKISLKNLNFEYIEKTFWGYVNSL